MCGLFSRQSAHRSEDILQDSSGSLHTAQNGGAIGRTASQHSLHTMPRLGLARGRLQAAQRGARRIARTPSASGREVVRAARVLRQKAPDGMRTDQHVRYQAAGC